MSDTEEEVLQTIAAGMERVRKPTTNILPLLHTWSKRMGANIAEMAYALKERAFDIIDIPVSKVQEMMVRPNYDDLEDLYSGK